MLYRERKKKGQFDYRKILKIHREVAASSLILIRLIRVCIYKMTVLLTMRDENASIESICKKTAKRERKKREKEKMTSVLRKGESFSGRAARKRAVP